MAPFWRNSSRQSSSSLQLVEVSGKVQEAEENLLSLGIEDNNGRVAVPEPPSNTQQDEEDLWSDANVAAVAELWKLSDTQVAQLREIQTLVADVDHWKNDPYEVVRYLKEYRQVQKAATMFRKMVQWRVDGQVDTFMDRYQPPILMRYLPAFLCQGLDREGDPIYIERFGVGDQYGLVCAHGHSVEPLAEYTQFIREYTTTRRRDKDTRFCWQRDYYEKITGRRTTQFTAMMDMKDLSHRNIRGGLLGLLKRMSRISQDMYSGLAKRVLILRAPAIFEWGWNSVVKHFFDQHIRDMITITSAEDYLQVMEQYIDLTVLPPCIAPGIGQGKAMPGYFESVVLEGGLIPATEEQARKVLDIRDDHFEPLHGIDLTTEDQSSPRDSNQHPRKRQVSVLAGSLLKGRWEVSSIATDDTEEETTEFSVRSTCTEVTVYAE